MTKKFTTLGTVFAAGALAIIMTVNAFAAHITEEKAKSIALEDADVKYENLTYIKKELDREDGRLVYEIEFLTNDNKEYDYEIDAGTGAVISCSFEEKNRSRSSEKKQEKAAITLEEAKAAALKYAKLEEADVSWGKVKQDRDDGRLIYEGEFFYNSSEYEFEIDASDGKILEWDMER